MSERKRKRGEQSRSEHPNKKTATAASAGIVKVSIVQEIGEWAPIIASTPGLSLPSQISFKPYRKFQADGRAQLPVSPELFLHSSSHPTIDYTAQEESSFQENLLNHYIGIYDPENGKLKLIPAHGVTVRRTLRQYAASDSSEREENPSQNLASQPLSSRAALGLAFGTRRSQKAIRSLTENVIRATPGKSVSGSPHTGRLDPAASLVLETMAAEATSVLTREDMQNEVDQAKPIPKPNLNAETPADVYPLERLVGSLALRNLQVQEWIDKVEAGEEISTKSKYVSERIVQVVKKGNVELLKALKYLLLLLEWYHSLNLKRKGSRRVPKKEYVAKAIGWASSGLLEDLSKRFSEGSLLNKWYTHYLLTHICALALTIDAFAIDVNNFSADLRLDTKEVKKLYRELGCHVSRPTDSEIARSTNPAFDKHKQKQAAGAHSHYFARLKLPLKFPQLRVVKRRGDSRMGKRKGMGRGK